MDIQPITGRPEDARVTFDTEYEFSLAYPYRVTAAARKALEVLRIIKPSYPLECIIPLNGLYKRQSFLLEAAYSVDARTPEDRAFQMCLIEFQRDMGMQIQSVDEALCGPFDS